jgi:hypothetical protein
MKKNKIDHWINYGESATIRNSYYSEFGVINSIEFDAFNNYSHGKK